MKELPFFIVRLERKMSRKPLGLLKTPESRKLRERAINCHRLAVGADDPEFAIKLEAIAGEYEARAIEADARTAPPKK
jgi:hypothetical protein